MRVLLVQHSKENVESFPIGLAYVAATLLLDGHEVRFIDLVFELDPVGSLTDSIRDFSPHALGFTLMTSQYDEFMETMRLVKEDCGPIKVVVGGAHASAESEQVLKDGMVDIVVNGEGETIASDLFRALEQGVDLSRIKGIAYIDEEGRFIQNENAGYIENLDNLPDIPYNLLQIHRYRGRIHGQPVVNIQTSRGCPYNCVFCYRGPSGGRNVRFRSVPKVFQDILYLYENHGIRAFNFCDDIFTLKRGRIAELCKLIKEARLKIYWTCETRVNTVDLELLKFMKEAGCVFIHFGVESGSQEIIDKLQKNITTVQAQQAFVHCQKLRIATLAFFIFGTPWDTPESIRETIEFAKKLKSTITVFLSAMPYPGTQLRELFIQAEMSVPEDYREYRQFTEGEYHKKGSFGTRQAEVQRLCMKATKEIIWSQILNVRAYPRLLMEFSNLYGISNFIQRAIKRLSVIKG